MNQQEFFSRYKYSIRTDKIGGGSFGTVYKAFDEVLNREVAIKVSEVKIMGGKEFSLKDEFDAIKDVPVHPNIANYEELITLEMPNGIFDYAIMQFYKDGNLSSFIKSNPTLAQKEQVALDLLEGISHLHKHKIVHRDLKPGNILIVKRGTKVIPVITDFGLSKQAELEGQSRFSNSFGGGTLKYSSPEQLKAEKLRLNTDLWAYGVIVHEIFTGKNLFMAEGITGASAEAEKEIYEQIIGVDISEMLNALPAKWKHVVSQCLERDGAKRIKTAKALKELIISGVTSTKDQASLIDDETIISSDIPEELPDAQTIIDRGQSIKKEEAKKEPLKKKQTQKKQVKPEKAKTKKGKFGFIGVFVTVVVIGLGGYIYTLLPSGIDSDWEFAKNLNTEESYEGYISLNPDGEHVEDAYDSLSWLWATSDNTTESYLSYLEEFPQGIFVEKANDNYSWLNAILLNSIVSYEAYVRNYPQGLFLEEANSKIGSLKDEALILAIREEEKKALEKAELDAWNKAKSTNTTNSYNEYIQSYNDGKYRNRAENAIAELNTTNYNKGYDYYLESDYKNALKYFNKSAKGNNKDAQYYLGSMYYYGRGVTKNYKTSMDLLRKSATQGHLNAEYFVGHLYYNGQGVDVDFKTALKWYKKSAEQGYAKSQYMVGHMYYNGNGVSKDFEIALKWYKKSAEQGYSESQYMAGYMYYSAEGSDLDNDKALHWFRKSADQDSSKSQKYLGFMYHKGYGVKINLETARYWYKKACDNNDSWSCSQLKELD